MDDFVKAAMAKWPNVPEIDGYLFLDIDGRWTIKEGKIDRPNIIAFINRNYQRDDETGRWYFQNGPQRVWVTPDATPLVVTDLESTAHGLSIQTHHGAMVQIAAPVFRTDERGNLYIYLEDAESAIIAPRLLGRLIDALHENDDGSTVLVFGGHRYPITTG